MPKPSKPFILKDKHGTTIGHGKAYPEGNVQVYLDRDNHAAQQMQLSDVLSLDGVKSFHWEHPKGVTVPNNGSGNDVWNRIDGAYNPNEFE